jgi:hypothetical protein
MNTTVRIVSNKTTLRFPASLPGEKGEAANRSGCVMVSPSTSGSSALTTGTSKAVVRIPSELGGMVLTDAGAGLSSPSTSGPVTVQMRRVRAGASVNMLTTEIAIDQNEYDSVTGTAGIINQSNRAVQAGDHIHFDVTSAGNSALGLVISFTFQPV